MSRVIGDDYCKRMPRFTQDGERQPLAIGHQGDSGDLEIAKSHTFCVEEHKFGVHVGEWSIPVHVSAR